METPVSFSSVMPMTAPAPMRIELEDPTPHIEFLRDLFDDLACDNIKIEAVMLPVRSYFTLKAYIDTRGRQARGMEIMGIRVLMNPRRDSGPPDLIFDDENALRVLSRRKK